MNGLNERGLQKPSPSGRRDRDQHDHLAIELPVGLQVPETRRISRDNHGDSSIPTHSSQQKGKYEDFR